MDNAPPGKTNAESPDSSHGETHRSGRALGDASRRRGGLLLEFAMIIIGALLALALDDWRDNQERDERDRAALVQLAAELETNQSLLATQSEYHRDMRGPIAEARERMQADGVFGMPEGWTGSQPILLTRTAFDLAVMSGVLTRVSPEAALSLARVYEMVERGQQRRQNVSLATLQSSFRDGTRYLRLQEQAIYVELENVDALLPLLEEAIREVDAAIADR